MNAKTILVAVNDIFFYTKVRDALLPHGYKLERARTQDDFNSKAAADTPAAVVMDMNELRLDPFLAGAPAEGLGVLDLETRSLLQVLFFVSHGVNVPADHITSGVAPQTVEPDGRAFDWQQVLGGLFKVCHAKGKKAPECAHVAVRYEGYWFYIDQRDRDSMSTFHLLVELSRLELGAKAGSTPLLTIPLGGR